ncbi:MAG: thiol:disulfide interchange protein DsbA/DsbL [Burkholderiales bacterium]|nr:thiol:disulfide interchange protein DsbA/DsbL [Burkholderiales bacterium]
MTLARRDFSLGLVAAGLGGAGLVAPATAQQAWPAENVHYVRLEQPAPVAAVGKIEVVEFFWYECPHCNAFEPALEAWSKNLPANVVLRRVPVWFQETPFAAQQRLFYTLEALGLVPSLQRKVFAAIHNDRARLRTPEDMAAFALKNGADPIRFMTLYGSPAVAAQCQQARQLAEAYKIDAVPAMGVQGRFYTNGNLANTGQPAKGPAVGNERLLGVVDTLVARVRKAG